MKTYIVSWVDRVDRSVMIEATSSEDALGKYHSDEYDSDQVSTDNEECIQEPFVEDK